MAQNQKDVDKFDIKIVHDKFEAALQEEDDVDLELYLESFEELNKFFNLMGTIFGFVSKDLRQKMDHLNGLLRDNDTSHKYKTVKRMIEHEKETDLLHQEGYISGSRTLLRIHRGLVHTCPKVRDIGNVCANSNYNNFLKNQNILMQMTVPKRTFHSLSNTSEFIQLFLKKIGELENHDSTVEACREAYDQTLAKYHTFLIKTGARVAMYTLPTREQLLKRVCGEEEDIKRAVTMLPKTLAASGVIYTRIDTLYTIHDLHSLP